MKARLRIYLSWLAPALLLAAAACQGQGVPAAATSVAGVAAPPSASAPPSAAVPAGEAATASFQGDIPVAPPAEHEDQAGDTDSSRTATKKLITAGDTFIHGLFERPFNADPMDKYFAYLDVVGIQGFMDDTWGYATITLVDTDANGGLPGQYAVELDLNRDGRGDWLIRASNVASDQWSTQGVEAWNDADGSVGAAKVMAADSDSAPPGGNGYEVLGFDQGTGSLTDGAWARIKPDDPKTVEIAFKLSMIGDPTSYAMGAWAGTSIDPAVFDHHDHMTHAQAGSPYADFAVYPLKALAEIDNTCRLAIGFDPTGLEPGLCYTQEQRVKEESGETCVPHVCGRNDPPGCVDVSCP